MVPRMSLFVLGHLCEELKWAYITGFNSDEAHRTIAKLIQNQEVSRRI